MTRNITIKWLKWIQNMFPQDSEQYKALQVAINSLEVDEAYDLMYEHIPFITLDELKEMREDVDHLQTYKLFSGDTELYLSKDDVISILDKKISTFDEKE